MSSGGALPLSVSAEYLRHASSAVENMNICRAVNMVCGKGSLRAAA